MNNRTILKGLFLVAFIDAVFMAIVLLAPSYSQLALTPWDGFLQFYLGCGAMGSLGMALTAENRNDLKKILFGKIQFGYLYLGLAVSFLMVSVVNVYDAYLAHMIATGLVAFFAYLIGWYYFPRGWKRNLSIVWETLGVIAFVVTVIWFKEFIARGEGAISFTSITIIWVIINEKIKK